jgi:general stress protein 26
MRARPMCAMVRREEHAIYFFADHRSCNCIRQSAPVCLTFADIRAQKYVCVSGTASLSTDPQKIRELWVLGAKVWWKHSDNSDIRLIKVAPETAVYWDSPGSLISSVKVAFALGTGGYPDPGAHRVVTM